jgi:hypothetical protein
MGSDIGSVEDRYCCFLRYHNAVEDLKGKIRVFCRVKPLLASEVTRDARLRVVPKDILSLSIHEHGKEPRR